MPSSTDNVKIGVCEISFAGNDLGYTKGGVGVEVTTDTHEVMIDQFGNTPINEYLTARSITVTTPLAETTLENLVSIMPGATLVTDSVDSSKKRVDVSHGIGTNLLDVADALVLHPKSEGASTAFDLTLPKAATAGAMNFSYNLDAERIFDCTWKGYPDTSNNNIMFQYGDLTATA